MKIYLSLFLLFFINYSFSQETKIIQYDAENGLPSSEVYDIIQDDYGYIWFSTDKGLSRYNGYEFETFDQSDGLIDNVVFDFFKQANGEIWCTTNAMKLFKFTGSEPIFTPYEFNDNLNLVFGHQILNAIYIGENEDVYVSFNHLSGYLHISATGEIKREPENPNRYVVSIFPCVLKNDSCSPFFFNEVLDVYSKGIPNAQFDKLLEEVKNVPNEALFMDSEKVGIYANALEIKLKYGNGDIIIIDSTNTKNVIALGKFDSDKFWVGYNFGGVKIFNTDGKQLAALLPNQSVSSLYTDKGSNVWMSTLEGGVFQLKNQEVKVVSESVGRHVSSLCLIDTGVYIGYKSGDIEYLNENYIVENFHQSKLNHSATITHDTIDDVTYFCADYLFSSQTSFLGDYFSRYIAFNAKHVFIGQRATVIIDKQGKPPEPLIFYGDDVRDVIFYHEKLYGANLKGVLMIDPEEEDKESTFILKDIRVDDLNVFNDHLVLGTNSKGVILLNKKHETIAQITKEDGLRSNSVSRTFTENDSTLWVCTNNGLIRLKFGAKGGYDLSYIDVHDGLLSNEIQDVTVYNDTLFIGTQKGVNYLAVEVFDAIQKKNKPYFLQWKKMQVNNHPISLAGGNDFKYYENKVECDFQAISFANNENLNYRFKLIGFDEVWNFTKNRNIIYSSLAPGKYELIVQVKGRNGHWDLNEIRYGFTINPPFWWTWWFICLVILAVVGVIYLFFKVRILTYNKDIVREILRLIMQRLRNEKPFILIKYKGKEVKVYSADIHFVKTNSNYLELYTTEKTYFIRSSIKQFLEDLPDAIEYLQIHRSYVVRLDNIQEVGKKFLLVLNAEIPIGRKYAEALKLIQL